MSLFKRAEFLTLLEKTIWNKVEKKLLPIMDYKSKRGCTFDLQEIFQMHTFDSILVLLIDYDPGTLSMDLPYNKFERAFTKAEKALFNRHFFPKWLWKLLNRLQIGSEKHLTDAEKLSDELLYNAIKENQNKKIKSFDVAKEEAESSLLTGFMSEYKDQMGSFGNHEKFIKDALFSLMVAGRDTTSSALTWFFYLLAQYPAAETKIREEIHAQLGMKEGQSWKSFSAKELERLVYLHGALCEALRLFPPLPANQKLSLHADTLPSGHQVRKNTNIILHSYSMGRMDSIWGQDSLHFKPERWLLKNKEIKHVPSYKFATFHAGPRTCLGKQISFIEMKIVAATIIYNYHVKVMEGHPNVQNASVFVQHKHGLMVKVTRRNEAA